MKPDAMTAYGLALLAFKRAFEPKHVNDDTGLFAVERKRFIVSNHPVGFDIDHHVVF